MKFLRICNRYGAHIAQSAERILGKDEVTGSIPVVSSILIFRDLQAGLTFSLTESLLAGEISQLCFWQHGLAKTSKG